jgi:hypothetical protein
MYLIMSFMGERLFDDDVMQCDVVCDDNREMFVVVICLFNLYHLVGTDCLCYGPLQALFVCAMVNHGRTDPSGLTTNKLDASSLIKFLMTVPGLAVGGKPAVVASSENATDTAGVEAGGRREPLRLQNPRQAKQEGQEGAKAARRAAQRSL